MKKLAVDVTSKASSKSVRQRVSLPMRLNEPQSSFERMTRSFGSSSVTESGVLGESVAEVSNDSSADSSTNSSTESADEVGVEIDPEAGDTNEEGEAAPKKFKFFERDVENKRININLSLDTDYASRVGAFIFIAIGGSLLIGGKTAAAFWIGAIALIIGLVCLGCAFADQLVPPKNGKS